MENRGQKMLDRLEELDEYHRGWMSTHKFILLILIVIAAACAFIAYDTDSFREITGSGFSTLFAVLAVLQALRIMKTAIRYPEERKRYIDFATKLKNAERGSE